MAPADFTVYVLYSRRLDRFYTGFSKDGEKRCREHRHSRQGWTAQAGDWVRVHQERVETRAEARALEKRIKKRGAHRYLLDIGADLQELLDSR